MQSMLPLMLVPLVVWIAVWAYLWTLDRKVKQLSADVARQESEDGGQ
jgi:CcmD family protein